MLLAVIRDVAIIILAFESIALGVLLFILAFQIYRLIRLIDREIKPILESAQRTTKMVEGTTAIVGEAIAKPAIELASFLSAVKHVVKILTKRRR